MDALATIPLEIKVTFAAVLVVALISALQILDLRRAKQDFNRKMQELSDSSGKGQSKKCCLISTWSLILQFIFGIIAFVLLSSWAFFLLQERLIGAALCSGIFALVGIAMPIYVWVCCKRKAKEMARLINEIESRQKTQAVQEKSSVAAQIREVKEELAVAATTVAEKAPVSEIKPAPVVKVVSPEPVRKVQYVESIPEDSMLRRHYDTHMASLQQSSLKQAPASKLQAEPVIVAETRAETVATRSHAGYNKACVPQDSMLRRHYLATLRSKIESGMPPRPTDSILKRHFDGWKNYLIECEIDKKFRGLSI